MLLLLVLGAPACRKREEPPSQPPPAAPQTAAEPESAQEPEAPAAAAEVPPPPAATAAAPASAPAPAPAREAFAPGLSREELLARAGACLTRAFVQPASGGRALSVEVFQPTTTACQERLGVQQYWVVGGVLESVRPGLLEPERPRRRSPNL